MIIAFKPQLRILGRKLGPKINELNKILQALNGVEAYRELKEKREKSLSI